MARIVLAPLAENDIEAILAHSQRRFGEQARLRYEALLVQAIQDIAEDPERPGSHLRAEIAESARTYHHDFSRDRVDSAASRVRQPRHFLLYRAKADGTLEVGRVLHDSMDLERHLPQDYRGGNSGDE